MFPWRVSTNSRPQTRATNTSPQTGQRVQSSQEFSFPVYQLEPDYEANLRSQMPSVAQVNDKKIRTTMAKISKLQTFGRTADKFKRGPASRGTSPSIKYRSDLPPSCSGTPIMMLYQKGSKHLQQLYEKRSVISQQMIRREAVTSKEEGVKLQLDRRSMDHLNEARALERVTTCYDPSQQDLPKGIHQSRQEGTLDREATQDEGKQGMSRISSSQKPNLSNEPLNSLTRQCKSTVREPIGEPVGKRLDSKGTIEKLDSAFNPSQGSIGQPPSSGTPLDKSGRPSTIIHPGIAQRNEDRTDDGLGKYDGDPKRAGTSRLTKDSNPSQQKVGKVGPTRTPLANEKVKSVEDFLMENPRITSAGAVIEPANDEETAEPQVRQTFTATEPTDKDDNLTIEQKLRVTARIQTGPSVDARASELAAKEGHQSPRMQVAVTSQPKKALEEVKELEKIAAAVKTASSVVPTEALTQGTAQRVLPRNFQEVTPKDAHNLLMVVSQPRRLLRTQQGGNRARNFKNKSDLDSNYDPLLMASVASENANSAMTQPQHYHFQSQLSSTAGKEMKNSFAFLNKLDPKEINSKMNGRDSALTKDGIPFFIKQMGKERKIRMNNSHNLRAERMFQVKSLQFHHFPPNCQPSKGNYIQQRVLANKKYLDLCMSRKMTVFEQEMNEHKRILNGSLLKQETTDGGTTTQIVVIDNEEPGLKEEDQPGVSHVASQQVVSSPAEVHQIYQSHTNEVLKTQGTTTNPIHIETQAKASSPKDRNPVQEVQSAGVNQKIISRVYSNTMTNDSKASPQRLSPHQQPRLSQNVEIIDQSMAAKKEGASNSAHRMDKEIMDIKARLNASVNDVLDNRKSSAAKSRQESRMQTVQLSAGMASLKSTQPLNSRNKRMENRRQSGSPSNRGPQSMSRKTQESLKHSDRGPQFDINELTNLLQLNAKGYEDLMVPTPKSIKYAPIRSKMQRLGSHLRGDQPPTRGEGGGLRTPAEIQQYLNFTKAKGAKTAEGSSRRRQPNPRGATNHVFQVIASSSENSSTPIMPSNMVPDLAATKMMRVILHNQSHAQREGLSKPLWIVGKHPRSRVVNYKTCAGQQLSKISGGEFIRGRKLLSQSRAERMTESLMDQTLTQSIQSSTIQRESVDKKDTQDLLRASYGMSNLKVAVDPKYLNRSKRNWRKQLNQGGKRGFSEDFDDINLCYPLPMSSGQQAVTQERNSSKESSVRFGSPSSKTRVIGDRPSSLAYPDKIPTALQEGGDLRHSYGSQFSHIPKPRLLHPGDNLKIQHIIDEAQNETLAQTIPREGVCASVTHHEAKIFRLQESYLHQRPDSQPTADLPTSFLKSNLVDQLITHQHRTSFEQGRSNETTDRVPLQPMQKSYDMNRRLSSLRDYSSGAPQESGSPFIEKTQLIADSLENTQNRGTDFLNDERSFELDTVAKQTGVSSEMAGAMKLVKIPSPREEISSKVPTQPARNSSTSGRIRNLKASRQESASSINQMIKRRPSRDSIAITGKAERQSNIVTIAQVSQVPEAQNKTAAFNSIKREGEIKLGMKYTFNLPSAQPRASDLEEQDLDSIPKIVYSKQTKGKQSKDDTEEMDSSPYPNVAEVQFASKQAYKSGHNLRASTQPVAIEKPQSVDPVVSSKQIRSGFKSHQGSVFTYYNNNSKSQGVGEDSNSNTQTGFGLRPHISGNIESTTNAKCSTHRMSPDIRTKAENSKVAAKEKQPSGSQPMIAAIIQDDNIYVQGGSAVQDDKQKVQTTYFGSKATTVRHESLSIKGDDEMPMANSTIKYYQEMSQAFQITSIEAAKRECDKVQPRTGGKDLGSVQSQSSQNNEKRRSLSTMGPNMSSFDQRVRGSSKELVQEFERVTVPISNEFVSTQFVRNGQTKQSTKFTEESKKRTRSKGEKKLPKNLPKYLQKEDFGTRFKFIHQDKRNPVISGSALATQKERSKTRKNRNGDLALTVMGFSSVNKTQQTKPERASTGMADSSKGRETKSNSLLHTRGEQLNHTKSSASALQSPLKHYIVKPMEATLVGSSVKIIK